MRWLIVLVMAVPLSGCTVFKTVHSPWPVINEPQRPSLRAADPELFATTPPTEREQVLLRDIHAVSTYSMQLEAGVRTYNAAAKKHNEKTLQDIAELTKVPQLEEPELD